MNIKKFLKQLFCNHDSIYTTTETNTDGPLFMVKSKIECRDCGKVLPLHPVQERCCYILHVHRDMVHEYLRDKFILEMKKMEQK
jgi:hypothetical protein